MGRPRLALEEFEIGHNLAPDDIINEVGYCYALNENGYGKKARQRADELFLKHPSNREIKDLNRYFQKESK